MNICYINPTKVLRRPIVEIADLLAKKGHKISIIYPEDKKNPLKGFHFQKLLSNKNIKLLPISSYYLPSLRYTIPNPLKCRKIIKEALKNNDIVHIWEYYYPYSVCPLIKKRLFRSKAKIILTTDGFVGYSYKPNLLLTILFKIYTNLSKSLLFKTPDKLTTYSNYLKKYADKLNIKNIEIISTGVDLKKFKPKIKNNIRKEFNIKKDEILITFIGMLTERKRPLMAIKAAKLLRNNKIRMLIIGHGYLDKECRYKVRDNEKIIITPNRKDIPEILNATNILFNPGVGEGLPGVVMEAAACGVPSIASDEGGTPDIVLHAKTGILCDPNKEVEYYKALNLLIKKKKLRENMGKEALKHIKNFDWNKIIKKYEDLYKELL